MRRIQQKNFDAHGHFYRGTHVSCARTILRRYRCSLEVLLTLGKLGQIAGVCQRYTPGIARSAATPPAGYLSAISSVPRDCSLRKRAIIRQGRYRECPTRTRSQGV